MLIVLYAACSGGAAIAETDTATEEKAASSRRGGPVAIASGNGLKSVARAYQQMIEGSDPLDAAIAGVNIQELDTEDQSVGVGGLPNEDGVVQLDASCMHGPTRRAGAVAAIEGIATPSLVAKAVMDYTDHIMLVGEGAKRFALSMGFKEQDLLTEKSRRDWLRWKANHGRGDSWLDHEDDVEIAFTHGTINLCALDAKGDLGSVTTTSGMAWKVPGRAGDSPVVGAGQYCDNEVGAAGSTGRGEANIKVCGAFLAVELMRGGVEPRDACLQVLARAVAMTEARLLGEDGRPLYGLTFYALRKDGASGAATLYPSAKSDSPRTFAVADADGARLATMATLYDTPRS
jgi:N4-(beta-N-acetylglucosaminyl)-L-asparaginase